MSIIKSTLSRRSRSAVQSAVASIALLLSACASDWSPMPVDTSAFLERSQTQEDDGVRVTAAVPSKAESQAIFDANVYKRGVQPVWIEVVNNREDAVVFLPLSTDADYFTPLEAASMHANKKNKNDMERYFFANGAKLSIAPGEVRSGFVFTHPDEGTKSFNVDIFGDDDSWHYTFFIPVPGLKIDHYNVDFAAMYSVDEVAHVDTGALIAALEALPCCVKDKKGENDGDPLNIAVVGDPKDVYYAFIRAGWDETEAVGASSGLKTAISFISGGEYRYSPVSSLYVYGRPQDIALQKARDNIHERNHLRLWMSPMKFEGKAVWIGQISRDIGVRFTSKTITTHKIDPDVDETREYLLENLAYHQALQRFGYVAGTVPAPIDTPRQNLTGDPYFTDGLRVVLWVSSDQISLDEIDMVDWKHPRN